MQRFSVAVGGKGLSAGDELVLHTGINGKHNDNLIVEHGYVWDDMRSASIPIRMSTHDWEQRVDKLQRDAMLKVYNLKPSQDFYLRGGKDGKAGIPLKLLVWGRVMFATKAEIAKYDRSIAENEFPLGDAQLFLDETGTEINADISLFDGLTKTCLEKYKEWIDFIAKGKKAPKAHLKVY